MIDDKVIATHYGFKCRYTPTIMSGPVIRWSRGSSQVSASRDGVMVHRTEVMGTVATMMFLKLVEKASIFHQFLERLGHGSIDPILERLKVSGDKDDAALSEIRAAIRHS